MKRRNKIIEHKRILYKKLKQHKLFQKFCLAYAYAYCYHRGYETNTPKDDKDEFLARFIRQRLKIGDESFDNFIEEVKDDERWQPSYNGRVALMMY